MASQITGVSVVYSNVCSDADQRNHQSSKSLAFVRGVHWWPVNFPHKMTSSWRHWSPIEYHSHIWQVLPHLRCGDTWQIRQWFVWYNFSKIQSFHDREINELSFSNPHPWTRTQPMLCLQLGIYNICYEIYALICCLLFCSGYIIRLMWCIYLYLSELCHRHWDNQYTSFTDAGGPSSLLRTSSGLWHFSKTAICFWT